MRLTKTYPTVLEGGVEIIIGLNAILSRLTEANRSEVIKRAEKWLSDVDKSIDPFSPFASKEPATFADTRKVMHSVVHNLAFLIEAWKNGVDYKTLSREKYFVPAETPTDANIVQGIYAAWWQILRTVASINMDLKEVSEIDTEQRAEAKWILGAYGYWLILDNDFNPFEAQ